MVTNWGLLVWVLVLIAITLVNTARLEVVGFDTQALIDEDKVYEAEWQHCPEGASQPVTMRVSDESWQAFQVRYNNMIQMYPPNC